MFSSRHTAIEAENQAMDSLARLSRALAAVRILRRVLARSKIASDLLDEIEAVLLDERAAQMARRARASEQI